MWDGPDGSARVFVGDKRCHVLRDGLNHYSSAQEKTPCHACNVCGAGGGSQSVWLVGRRLGCRVCATNKDQRQFHIRQAIAEPSVGQHLTGNGKTQKAK